MPTPQNQPLSGEFILAPTPHNNPAPPDVTNAEAAKAAAAPIQRTHSTPKFYSSLAYYPDGVNFQDQDADEEIILLIRRDSITNVPWIISVILLALVPPALFFLVPIFFPVITVTQPFIYLSVVFYYLVLSAFTLLYFVLWYFNVGLVTNKRIIDLDVPNILVKETSEARLNSIADVTLIQVGGIRGFFDYGDIKVLTETYEQHIEFDRVPNPNMIRRVIGELIVDKPTT